MSWQYEENRRQAELLRAEGYEFQIDKNGYRVDYKGKFVSAAGVKLPREYPLRGGQARANCRFHLEQCVVTALRHRAERKSA